MLSKHTKERIVLHLKEPGYRALVNTGVALIFGMLPILITWLLIEIFKDPNTAFGSVLQHGDALMVASALSGPALVLVGRRRKPETMAGGEILMVIGVLLVLACAAIFTGVNTIGLFNDSLMSQQVEIAKRITSCSIWLLSLSFLYALYVSFQDARSATLASFLATYTAEQKEISTKVDFSGGR